MIDIETLPNGVTLLLEQIPTLRSVAVGITVKAGSGCEAAEENGLSHFLEHLAFKGTTRRDALAISEEIDAIGGRLNAHTGKESTTYHAQVLDEHLDVAVALLADIVLNPRYTPQDIELEKTVVQEEIKLYEDTPDELVHDLFLQNTWPDHSLGRSILGTRKNVSDFTKDHLLAFRRRYYTPQKTIISIAGNIVDLQQAKTLVYNSFSSMAGDFQETRLAQPRFQNTVAFHDRQSHQNHICWGCPGLSYHDDRRYVMSVLNNILGGTMSSRLFQEVREKRGLAYSIYSYPTFFAESGCFNIGAGAAAATTLDVLQIIHNEVEKLKQSPIRSTEIQKARENLKGHMVLSLEGASGRMNWNARSQLYYGKIVSLDEVFAKINAVTAEQVQALAHDLFQKDQQALTIIGRVNRRQRQRLQALLGQQGNSFMHPKSPKSYE